MGFDKQMAQWRETSGLTRKEFARKLSVSLTAVKHWETGPSTPLSHLFIKFHFTFLLILYFYTGKCFSLNLSKNSYFSIYWAKIFVQLKCHLFRWITLIINQFVKNVNHFLEMLFSVFKWKKNCRSFVCIFYIRKKYKKPDESFWYSERTYW